MPALREAWGYRGRRSDFDAGTWHAYEVLQAVDLLSLAHGLMDLEQRSARTANRSTSRPRLPTPTRSRGRGS